MIFSCFDWPCHVQYQFMGIQQNVYHWAGCSVTSHFTGELRSFKKIARKHSAGSAQHTYSIDKHINEVKLFLVVRLE